MSVKDKKPCAACIQNHRLIYMQLAQTRDDLRNELRVLREALGVLAVQNTRDIDLIAHHVGLERAEQEKGSLQ